MFGYDSRISDRVFVSRASISDSVSVFGVSVSVGRFPFYALNITFGVSYDMVVFFFHFVSYLLLIITTINVGRPCAI